MNRRPTSEMLGRLATNLRRLRYARGYTQHELARRCGLPNSYISEVELETVNITLANLEALIPCERISSIVRIIDRLDLDHQRFEHWAGLKNDYRSEMYHHARSAPDRMSRGGRLPPPR